jgi:enoyl-CoA hydratase/carnithine racemase
MTDEPILLCEDSDGVRLLTLNRPRQMNALSAALVAEILAAVDAAEADDSIAVIVMTGTERAFSAGADLKEAEANRTLDAAAARRHGEASGRLYAINDRTDKPIIAAVRGYALGGGCNLAISADMVVAGEGAIFGYPEVKRGIAATAVTPGLVHRIAPKAAFELMTLCENVPAQRALTLGMINRVVADDAVLDEAMAMARTLAGFDRQALLATKRVFRKSNELTLSQSLAMAQEMALLVRANKRADG